MRKRKLTPAKRLSLGADFPVPYDFMFSIILPSKVPEQKQINVQ